MSIAPVSLKSTARPQPTNPHTRERTPIARHDPPLLYNLDEDIGELNNIAGKHPDVVRRLLKELEAAKH